MVLMLQVRRQYILGQVACLEEPVAQREPGSESAEERVTVGNMALDRRQTAENFKLLAIIP